MRRALLFALTFLLPGLAPAAEAFKCTAADGSISFQDRPCRASNRQESLQLPDYRPPNVAEIVPSDAIPAPAEKPPPVVASPPVPPPSFFLCTRFDGSRYASDIGIGSTSWVPYEAVQGNRSLASTYGGPNGIGVSAPGLREPPHTTSPLAGTTYVQVDDECHRAAPQEACAWLQRELDDVRGKLRRAFSDTEAELKQRQRELGERLRGC